jgi:protein CpxP
MKLTKTLIPALFTAMIIGSTPLVHAEDESVQKHGEQMQQRMDKMKKELNLTDDQVKKMQVLHDKRKEEREAMKKEMDEILTPEQQEKAKKMRDERKAKRKNNPSDS